MRYQTSIDAACDMGLAYCFFDGLSDIGAGVGFDIVNTDGLRGSDVFEIQSFVAWRPGGFDTGQEGFSGVWSHAVEDDFVRA